MLFEQYAAARNLANAIHSMRDKPLLFADTNIFLDFYRSRGEAGLSLLKHIESVLDVLIMTDQIEVEFLNNRQKVISEALREIVIPEIKVVVPSYLREAKAVHAIDKGKAQIKKAVETLKERFANLLEDPAKNDPVYKIVKWAFASDNELSLKARGEETRKKILDAALLRFQRGFPPRKKQDCSAGDAINWEWILYCAKTFEKDVIIVARDSDFGIFDKGLLNDWLANEFREVTRRNAKLLPSLTQALKSLKIEVTPAEQQEERRLIQERTISANEGGTFPAFWPVVLEQVKHQAPAVYSCLSQAKEAYYASDKLVMFFEPSLSHVEETQIREHLELAFKELGFSALREVNFGAYAVFGHRGFGKSYSPMLRNLY